MKLRVWVIDQEHSLAELLRVFLVQQGHEVEVFRDPLACSLYRHLQATACSCSRDKPCADVLFAELDTPKIDAIALLKLQHQRGCKMVTANKAVMSNHLTRALDREITALGCHHIGKPFRLTEIRQWLKECVKRVTDSQGASR